MPTYVTLNKTLFVVLLYHAYPKNGISDCDTQGNQLFRAVRRDGMVALRVFFQSFREYSCRNHYHGMSLYGGGERCRCSANLNPITVCTSTQC